MTEEKQKELLESRIDTVIISIDSLDKKIHESIRRGTNLENVVENTKGLIRKETRGDIQHV